MLKKNKKILLTFLTISLSIIPLFKISAMKKKQPSYLPSIPEETKNEINNNVEITHKMLTTYYDIIKKYFNVENYKENIIKIDNLICLDKNNELDTKKFIENLRENNIISDNPYINYHISEDIKLNLTNFLKEIKTLLNKKMGLPTPNSNLNSNFNHKSNRNLKLKLNSKSNLKLNLSLSRNSSRNNLNINTLRPSQKKFPNLAPRNFAKTPSTPNLFNKTFKNNFKNNIKSIKNSITVEINADILKTYKKHIKKIKDKIQKNIDITNKKNWIEKIKNFICLNQNDELDVKKFLENLKHIEKLNKLNLPDYDEYLEYNLKIDEEEKNNFIKSLKNTRDFVNQNNNCNIPEELNNKIRIPVSIDKITTDYVNYIINLSEKYKNDIEKIKEIDNSDIKYEKYINPLLNSIGKLVELTTLRGKDLIEQLIRCGILIRRKNKNEEYYIPEKNIKKIEATFTNLVNYLNELPNKIQVISDEKITERKKLDMQKETDLIIKDIIYEKQKFEDSLNEILKNKQNISNSTINNMKENLKCNADYLNKKITKNTEKIMLNMVGDHLKIIDEKNKIENQNVTNKDDMIAKTHIENIINSIQNISDIILKVATQQNINSNTNNDNEEKDDIDEGYLKQLETIIKNMLTSILCVKNFQIEKNIEIKKQNPIFDTLFKEIINNVNSLYIFKKSKVSLELFKTYQDQLLQACAPMVLNIQNYKNLMLLKDLTKNLSKFYKEKMEIINNLNPTTISEENPKTVHKNKKRNRK